MNTIFDRLKQSRNPIERNSANMIESYFPNYEVFWSNYLISLRDKEGDWRYDMLPSLEELGMSQFGILKSLNFINMSFPHINVGDQYQRYKNIYFHFGLIFDSIDNFCRNLCIIKDKLGIKKLDIKLKQSKDTLIRNFKEWINKEYTKSYDEMVNFGKPILYHPHSYINYLKLLDVPNPLRRNYNKYVTSVRNYRNFFIHTPSVDVITSYGRLRAIKNEYTNEYRHWSKIKKH